MGYPTLEPASNDVRIVRIDSDMYGIRAKAVCDVCTQETYVQSTTKGKAPSVRDIVQALDSHPH